MTTTGQQPDARGDARLIHVRLKPETHKRLRIRTAEEDVTIQDWVEALIESGLDIPQGNSSGKNQARNG